MSAQRDRDDSAERVRGDAREVSPTLDDRLLMAQLARRYYWENRTRVQIADEFGLSRFKVSRLLDAAVSSGVVRIEIAVPEAVDADLSLQMKNAFGLERVLVTTGHDSRPQVVRDALGRAAAALLTDLVSHDDVLGLTSGRTIDSVARHLTRLPGCEIIQLTGMSGGLEDNTVEVLRRVATLSGGQARSIYAPLTVATAHAAEALKTDAQIAATFARFSAVTIAVAAVGSWQPPESRFFDALGQRDRDQLLKLDVSADIGGVLLDRQGQPVSAFDDRTLGIGLEELRAIEQVIMVAGGPRKAEAVLAVLRSGFVTTLVTDYSVATQLLSRRTP